MYFLINYFLFSTKRKDKNLLKQFVFFQQMIATAISKIACTFHSLFFAFGLIFLFFGVCLHAGDIYAILVGDSSDKVIASTVKWDMKLMKKEIRQIAKYSGQTLHLHVFEGKGATSEAVLNYLLDFQVSEDDVIIFYQSSHGFRLSSQETPWPILVYGVDEAAIYFEGINECLLGKQPRLLLSIADVCNNILEEETEWEASQNEVTRSKKVNHSQMASFYKSLFKESKGFAIICGAEPGCLSYADKRAGGLLTKSFLETLANESRKSQSNWETLMKKTVQKTQRHAKSLGVKQKPVYEVRLSSQ